jgi:hypothetical protein
MMYRIVFTISFCTITLLPSDDQELVKNACKQETMNNTKKSTLDPYIDKQIKKFQNTNPDGYKKMLAYVKDNNQNPPVPSNKKNN